MPFKDIPRTMTRLYLAMLAFAVGAITIETRAWAVTDYHMTFENENNYSMFVSYGSALQDIHGWVEVKPKSSSTVAYRHHMPIIPVAYASDEQGRDIYSYPSSPGADLDCVAEAVNATFNFVAEEHPDYTNDGTCPSGFKPVSTFNLLSEKQLYEYCNLNSSVDDNISCSFTFTFKYNKKLNENITAPACTQTEDCQLKSLESEIEDLKAKLEESKDQEAKCEQAQLRFNSFANNDLLQIATSDVESLRLCLGDRTTTLIKRIEDAKKSSRELLGSSRKALLSLYMQAQTPLGHYFPTTDADKLYHDFRMEHLLFPAVYSLFNNGNVTSYSLLADQEFIKKLHEPATLASEDVLITSLWAFTYANFVVDELVFYDGQETAGLEIGKFTTNNVVDYLQAITTLTSYANTKTPETDQYGFEKDAPVDSDMRQNISELASDADFATQAVILRDKLNALGRSQQIKANEEAYRRWQQGLKVVVEAAKARDVIQENDVKTSVISALRQSFSKAARDIEAMITSGVAAITCIGENFAYGDLIAAYELDSDLNYCTGKPLETFETTINVITLTVAWVPGAGLLLDRAVAGVGKLIKAASKTVSRVDDIEKAVVASAKVFESAKKIGFQTGKDVKDFVTSGAGKVAIEIKSSGKVATEDGYKFFNEIDNLNNPIPENGTFARVMPRQYVEELRAGNARFARVDPNNPSINAAFITAADDLSSLSKGDDIARKLSLFEDQAGTIQRKLGANDVIVEFKFKDGVATSLRSPIETPNNLRNYGFVGGGKTGGGAREWLIDSDAAKKGYIDLGSIKIREIAP